MDPHYLIYGMTMLVLVAVGVPAFLVPEGLMSKRTMVIWVLVAVLAPFPALYSYVFWGQWGTFFRWTLATETGILAAMALGMAGIGFAEYGDARAYFRILVTGHPGPGLGEVPPAPSGGLS